MSSAWTRDRVMELAPDAASAKAGEGLAIPRQWVSLGCDEVAVWGECQGSGSKPYQVRMELQSASYKCSCPSRKFPCKHNIALMLLFAGGQVAQAAQPQWVTQWLEERAERSAKKVEAQREITPEQQAQRDQSAENRRAKRVTNVHAAMQDLGLWIEDLISSGLASVPQRGMNHFDERARRLIDGQAPGAARMVAEIGSAASSGEGWQMRTLERAAMTYLLTHAFSRLDQLEPDLCADVLMAAGVPTPAEELASAPAVNDRWFVLGRETASEDRLKTRRTFVRGAHTGRSAVILDFAFGTEALPAPLLPGTCVEAALAFYPGRSLRAVVRELGSAGPVVEHEVTHATIAAMLDEHASLLAGRLWLTPVGFALRSVLPFFDGQRWWIVDSMGDALPWIVSTRVGAQAVAVAMNRPVTMTVTTDGRSLFPLGVIADGLFLDLGRTETTESVDSLETSSFQANRGP